MPSSWPLACVRMRSSWPLACVRCLSYVHCWRAAPLASSPWTWSLPSYLDELIDSCCSMNSQILDPRRALAALWIGLSTLASVISSPFHVYGRSWTKVRRRIPDQKLQGVHMNLKYPKSKSRLALLGASGMIAAGAAHAALGGRHAAAPPPSAPA